MKKCNKNIESNNNQMVFKSKISFNNNITNIEKNKENNDYNHFRYKTEPLKNKLSNLYLKTISKYFEESLNILQTIQQNLTISVDNNNKPLLKKKMKLNNQKKNNHYIKLSSMEKFDMAKTIIDNSNNRKEQYLEMFLLINSSIDEVRNLLMNDLLDEKEKIKKRLEIILNFSEIEATKYKNCISINEKEIEKGKEKRDKTEENMEKNEEENEDEELDELDLGQQLDYEKEMIENMKQINIEEEDKKEEKKNKKKPKYISSIIDLKEDEENVPTKKKIPDTLYGIQILGLPYETTEYELRQMFSKFGTILKIYLPKYKNTNKNIGHCYIYFSTEEAATKSLEMNNKRVGKRYMEISLYNMRNNSTKESAKLDPDDIPLDCTTAFVKNLPYNVTEDMVKEKFEACGEIKQLRFVYEPNKVKFKGFCYIDFQEHKGLVKALKLNGVFFEGRKLYVDYEQGKPKGNYKNTDEYRSGSSEVLYLNKKRY